MHYPSDEFLLLSRTGRWPPGSRAGPSGCPRPVHELPPAQPWLFQTAIAAVAGMLRRGPAEAARLDRDAYLDLEFAVGFTADDEPSL